MSNNVVIKHKSKYRLVARVDGRDAGYLRFRYAGDEALKRAMELEWVETYPKWRGLGVGTKLIKFFLKEIKTKYPSVVWVSLWTGKEIESEGRHNLYKTIGFKLLAIQKDYYDKKIHCRLYAKKVHREQVVKNALKQHKRRLTIRRKLAAKQLHPRKKKV